MNDHTNPKRRRSIVFVLVRVSWRDLISYLSGWKIYHIVPKPARLHLQRVTNY